MHRKKFWTNKWMQEPRKNCCRLQVHHCDPNVQYRKGWGSFKIKRGLTLCYNFTRVGHLDTECSSTGLICLCCKSIGHRVEDFPRVITKVEKMNMIQENYEGGQRTEDMLENQKELEIMLLQLRETLNDDRDISLPEIFKEK
jgi:hypothetical protein